MSTPDGVVALVPLRGGSRGIPGKNIRPLAGRPLCHWVLEAALGSPAISRVFVSTDSAEIAAVARALDPRVEVLDRPADLASDTASTESVMLHFAAAVPCDILVTVQATSPLLESRHLDAALARFSAERLDSLLTGVRTKRFFWRDDGTALNYDPQARPRRQDFAGSLMENGAFYITRCATLMATRCRLGGRIGIFEMEEETAIEIDEQADWDALAAHLARRGRGAVGGDLRRRLAGLRAVAVDVDGTLTDGGMWYGPEGEVLKRFDTRDGAGLRRLQELGVAVWIITGENSPIVLARARKLGIAEVHLGVTDKAAILRDLCQRHGIAESAVGYIGDDRNDLECLGLAGVSACPADARPEVRRVVDLQLAADGGHAAVREFADAVAAAKSA